jgi:hypothetical protein
VESCQQDGAWSRCTLSVSSRRRDARSGRAPFVATLSPVMAQPFSADGRKLFYLVRQGTRAIGMDQRSGALWVADLDTDRRQPLLPGFDVIAYDVSHDGKRIVFAPLDDKGRSHVWIGRLDGHLAPHQVSPVEADSPRFGTRNDIFFRMRDGADRFILRMGDDGGEMQKAAVEPVLFFMSVSPDGAWLIARVSPGEHAGNGVVAFSTRGGRGAPVCQDCEADWAPGGKSFVVRAFGFSQPRSVVIALKPGEALPRLPAGGLRSEADVAALDFAVGDGFRYPGRDALQYAYTKASIQRNIYRCRFSSRNVANDPGTPAPIITRRGSTNAMGLTDGRAEQVVGRDAEQIVPLFVWRVCA